MKDYKTWLADAIAKNPKERTPQEHGAIHAAMRLTDIEAALTDAIVALSTVDGFEDIVARGRALLRNK